MALRAVKGHSSLINRFYYRNVINSFGKFSTQHTEGTENIADDEFRVLELYPMKKDVKRTTIRFQDAQVAPPRETRMPIDQDWPSVWPTAKTFRPSVVPLPVYQGYDQKRAPPGKYANAELMKIPNFLHLTPPAIKRHCAAIKKFCTEWPKGLETQEDYDKHFPIEIITSDYCHSSPVIRDERSRIVTLKIKLRSLKLDYHGRDKLLRLIGSDRYDVRTDIITIIADSDGHVRHPKRKENLIQTLPLLRCPLRKQNYDYLMYLLTALHHESWVTEPWEHEKTEEDMEKFFFENSRIQKHITETVMKIKSTSNGEKVLVPKEIEKSPEVIEYGDVVTKLINEGEDESTILDYKKSVMKALGLQT